MAKKTDFKAVFEEQRAQGVNLQDPMSNLISKPEPKKKGTEAKATDKVKGFTPEAGGKRTKRVQIVMTPELYDRTKRAADAAVISFNELVNQLCNKVTQ